MSRTPNPLLVTEKEIDLILEEAEVATWSFRLNEKGEPIDVSPRKEAKTKLIDLMGRERQAWLDRFEEELKGVTPQYLLDAPGSHIVIQAAKRAAQLNTYRDDVGAASRPQEGKDE